jgi:hypothetical protein
MALEAARKIPGTDYLLNYHRIARVTYLPGVAMEIRVYSYPDEATRRANTVPAMREEVKVPFWKTRQKEIFEALYDENGEALLDEKGETVTRTVTVDETVNVEPVVTAGNVMETAYRYMKVLPDWFPAKDV